MSSVMDHINKLYNYVGVLADNHNKIVTHLNHIHKNVSDLQDNVRALKHTVTGNPASPRSIQPTVPSVSHSAVPIHSIQSAMRETGSGQLTTEVKK